METRTRPRGYGVMVGVSLCSTDACSQTCGVSRVERLKQAFPRPAHARSLQNGLTSCCHGLGQKSRSCRRAIPADANHRKGDWECVRRLYDQPLHVETCPACDYRARGPLHKDNKCAHARALCVIDHMWTSRKGRTPKRCVIARRTDQPVKGAQPKQCARLAQVPSLHRRGRKAVPTGGVEPDMRLTVEVAVVAYVFWG